MSEVTEDWGRDLEIGKVACVGAGLIGHSWATLLAWKGCEVTLQDSKKEVLKGAVDRIARSLQFLVENGLLEKDERKESLSRVDVTTSLEEAVEEADYVQESVFENYGAKRKVFKIMDASTPSHALLASSTSSLKMTVIQKSTRNPERCIVAHPWNPPHLMPLVEIIPGRKTSAETIESTRQFMKRLGKVPVLQKKETTGSIGNRLTAALWREAIDLVDKGIADLDDVDKAVSAGPGLRWAIMGPHMGYHLGGGKGGMEYFVEHLGPAMEARWRSLAKWTSFPPLAAKKLIEGVKNSEMTKERSIEELAKWRDEQTVKLLKVLYGKEV